METSEHHNITIIGAGYVGLCTGAILSEFGNNITFLDVNAQRINSINNGRSPVYEPGLDDIIREGVNSGKITATTNYEEISSSKTFIMSVNTPINKDYEVDLTYLISACKSLSKVINKGSLVILRSTVPPLTLKNYIAPIFIEEGFLIDHDVYFSVIPERLAEGHALKDMKENPVIVGVRSDDAFKLVEKLWSKLDQQIIRISWEEAELTKLSDNLWIDLNIAMANEIALVAEKIGADARKVIKAANTLKKGSGYVNILMPGVGVGGSCLPKDPHILNAFSRKMGVDLRIPTTSRSVNDQMPEHMYNLIKENMENKNNPSILMLGLSFNTNSGDMRYSPSIYLNENLQKAGFKVFGYDPLVNRQDLGELHNVTIIENTEQLIEILSQIDVVAIVAAHNTFKDMKNDILKPMKNKLIVDGRYLFEESEVAKFGVKYVAIGVGHN